MFSVFKIWVGVRSVLVVLGVQMTPALANSERIVVNLLLKE